MRGAMPDVVIGEHQDRATARTKASVTSLVEQTIEVRVVEPLRVHLDHEGQIAGGKVDPAYP